MGNEEQEISFQTKVGFVIMMFPVCIYIATGSENLILPLISLLGILILGKVIKIDFVKNYLKKNK